MTNVDANVDFTFRKDTSIRDNTDAYGSKWGIVCNKRTMLYQLGKSNAEGDIVVPKNYPKEAPDSFQGQFTKAEYADKEIKSWLTSSWAKAEHATKKQGKSKPKSD